MYRARAEAVSGTRVYADGKWLQCIGNKCVSVGDRIWTDGRCVYGHFQESQQPPVITAPEDEGIPILIEQTVQEDEYLVTKKDYYIYDSRLRTLKAPEELELTGTEFINDYKRDTYLVSYDGASTFYATNIDKKGNVYKLIGTNTMIKIYKNEEEVSTTSLSDLIAQQREEAINSIPSNSSVSSNSPPGASYKVLSKFAVIENENDWNALLFLYIGASQGISGKDVDVSYTRGESTRIERYDHASGSAEFFSTTVWLVNQDSCTPINSCIGTTFDLWSKEVLVADLSVSGRPYNWRTVFIEGEHAYSASLLPPNTDVKIKLQDGFYFTINDYPNFPDNMFCHPIFMKISIYTKKDVLLLTETFQTRSRITISKVKSRYLIAVRHTSDFYGTRILDINIGYTKSNGIIFEHEGGKIDYSRYNAYATETPYVDEGLYLYDGETLTKIADGTCLNARLRAIPKYKNWQKRIQQL